MVKKLLRKFLFVTVFTDLSLAQPKPQIIDTKTVYYGRIHLSRKMQDLENSMYNTSKTLRGMFRCLVHRIQNNIENITSNPDKLSRS